MSKEEEFRALVRSLTHVESVTFDVADGKKTTLDISKVGVNYTIHISTTGNPGLISCSNPDLAIMRRVAQEMRIKLEGKSSDLIFQCEETLGLCHEANVPRGEIILEHRVMDGSFSQNRTVVRVLAIERLYQIEVHNPSIGCFSPAITGDLDKALRAVKSFEDGLALASTYDPAMAMHHFGPIDGTSYPPYPHIDRDIEAESASPRFGRSSS